MENYSNQSSRPMRKRKLLPKETWGKAGLLVPCSKICGAIVVFATSGRGVPLRCTALLRSCVPECLANNAGLRQSLLMEFRSELWMGFALSEHFTDYDPVGRDKIPSLSRGRGHMTVPLPRLPVGCDELSILRGATLSCGT